MPERSVKIGDQVQGGKVVKILPYEGGFKHFFDCVVILDSGKQKAYCNEWREHIIKGEKK